jgi:hypothetical protein
VDKHRAKEILRLYRPGSADREDPEFKEALSLTQRDSDLAQWFSQYCAVQEALRAKFRQLPVPEGLKEQILSERKVHLAVWKRPETRLASVAVLALALLLGLAAKWSAGGQENNLASLNGKIKNTILRDYLRSMDLYANDLGQIQQHLAEKGRGNYQIPKALAETLPTGCGVFSWHGKPVAMVCFNSHRVASAKDSDLFLFIVDRNELADAPDSSSPMLKPDKHLSTASWSLGDKTYVLAGLGNEDFVRKHL